MINNEKLAYDLALIYTQTKFDAANKIGVAGLMNPKNEPDTELKMLAMFFNDAYNQLLSYDLSETTEL